MFSAILVSISLFYRRKINRRKTLSQSQNKNGFHRYNVLMAENSEDEETGTSKFINKPINADLKTPTSGLKYTKFSEVDNQKLLSNLTDDEEEDCDRIFER